MGNLQRSRVGIATSIFIAGLVALALLVGVGASGADEPASSDGPELSAEARAQLGQVVTEARDKADAAINSPAAVSERERSQTAFADLTDAQAADVADEKFDADKPLWQSPIGDHDDVLKRLDARTVVIDRPGVAGRMLVDSTTPLTVPASDGGGTVSLDIESDGSDFALKNPLVDLSIDKDIADGVDVGDSDVNVAPTGVDQSVDGTDTGERVFYANAATDTDYMVAPLPAGEESFWQLRSPDSPTELGLDMDIPQGATLETAEHHGLTAIDVVKDGSTVATISEPKSVDAQGKAVPTTYELDGDKLKIHVDHRDADIAYPVLVDPVLTDSSIEASTVWWYGWSNQYTQNGFWGGVGSGPYGWTQQLTASLGVTYGAWAYDRWLYQAPSDGTNEGSWVENIAAGPTYADLSNGFCSMIGVAKPDLSDYEQGANGWGGTGAATWCTPSNYYYWHGGPAYSNNWGLRTRRNIAEILLVNPWAARIQYIKSQLANQALTVVLGDDAPAHLTAFTQTGQPTATAPNGWIKQPTLSGRIAGHDGGLGVKWLNVLADGVPRPASPTHTCNGTAHAPCQFDWSSDNYSVPAPQGRVSIAGQAVDILGQGQTGTATTYKIDNEPPVISLSGALWDKRNQTVTGPLSLTVNATDGSTANAAAQRSGVKRIQIYTKPSGSSSYSATPEYDSQDQTCTASAASCPLSRTWSFDPSTRATGNYDIQVRATDQLGQEETNTFSVTVDRTAPDLVVSGAGFDPTTWIRSPAPINLHATDAGGSGVTDLSVTVDGSSIGSHHQGCATSACELSHDFSIRGDTLGDGSHVVIAKAQDASHNEATKQWTVKVDRTRPVVTLTGALAESEGDQISGDSDLHVKAQDSASGAVKVEIKLDGNQQSVKQQPCASGGCTLETDWHLDSESLSAGPHVVEVISTDAAGNEKSSEVPFNFVLDGTPVAPPLDPTVANSFIDQTSFLYDGPNAIQDYVTPGTIEAERAAVIRGKISQRDGTPLSGVTVTVLDHPEYGTTRSRVDGEIYMGVNGGGPLTVVLQKPGYLPVQRRVDVPWQDYAFIDDVVMIQPDLNVSTITTGNPLSQMQVHRGTREQDSAGSRQATLLFPGGLDASMEMPDGSLTPLSQMHVRATEYTVGANGRAAMPGELPPTSAYTYATEFSVDEARAAGAEHVRFSKPVIGYVENFRNFPVGSVIPNGYYEKKTGRWEPDTDGVVVKILNESGSSVSLDIAGHGQAATSQELSDLGVTADELAKLADLYGPGDELWRVPTKHFSDWNVMFRIKGFPIVNPLKFWQKKLGDVFCPESGSVIECDNQVLGEEIPLTGTDSSLHYRSNTVLGRKGERYSMEIPLTEDNMSSAVTGVSTHVDIAGKRYELGPNGGPGDFPTSPGSMVQFDWDGRDVFGRHINGAVPATVSVAYRYDVEWVLVPRGGGGAGYGVPAFFGQAPEEGIGGGLADDDSSYLVSRESQIMMGGIDQGRTGLGGWSLTDHHQYDPRAQILFRGDGNRQQSTSSNRVIDRFAGASSGQTSGYSGDGGPATNAKLSQPQKTTTGPDGSLYIADTQNGVIRKVSPDGTISTFAGNQASRGHFAGDGGPAVNASLWNPVGVAVGPDGSVYIVDSANSRIRKVTPDGKIQTVAGGGSDAGGTAAYPKVAGPATGIQLLAPAAVEVTDDGTIFIGDRARIIRVAPGGEASKYARVGYVYDLALAKDGGLLVAHDPNGSLSGTVDEFLPDGTSKSVAGTPYNSASIPGNDDPGEEIPADARLDIRQIAISPEGDLYLHAGDQIGDRVWMLGDDGKLHVVMGDRGAASSSAAVGNGGPARNAKFGLISGLSFGPDGSMFVSDWSYHTVRRVAPSLPGYTGDDLAVPSSDGNELYKFDKDGRHLETRSTLTGALLTRFEYDSRGLVTKEIDGDGNELTVNRSSDGTAESITAPRGQETELQMDSANMLSGVDDPAGRHTGLSYTSNGLLTSFQLPGGRTSNFEYDAKGRLTKDTNADGEYKTLERTDTRFSTTSKVTTRLGRQATYTLTQSSNGDVYRATTNAAGLHSSSSILRAGAADMVDETGTVFKTTLTSDSRFKSVQYSDRASQKRPSGATASVSRARTNDLANPDDPMSLERQVDTTTIGGRTATETWNKAARTLTTHGPDGITTVSTYDAQGRITKEQAPGFHDVDYSYDTDGRLTEVTQGSRTVSYEYDSHGSLSAVEDSLGARTEYTNDALGRVTTQSLPGGRTVGFSYTAAGDLAGITPPGHAATVFDYSPGGKQAATDPPAVGSESPTQVAYDHDGDVSSLTKADGTEIDVERDSAGRLTAIDSPDSRLETGYDSKGRIASVDVPGGQQIDRQYDGQVMTSEQASGEVDGEVTQARDGEGRLTSSTVIGTPAVNYTYDSAGRAHTGGALTFGWSSQTGLLSGTTLGSLETSLTYDEYGDVSELGASHSNSQLFDQTLDRDSGGRVTSIDESVGGSSKTIAYEYDAAQRLKKVSEGGDLVVEYGYDTNGNRVSEDPATGPTLTSSYDAQDRLVSRGSVQYDWTQAGELKTRTDGADVTEYLYDDLGVPKGADLPDGRQVRYVTDGLGRRVGKKVDGNLIAGWVYGETDHPSAELDGNGDVRSRFVYGTSSEVPDYMLRGGNTYRLITDQLGSVRLVVNTQTGGAAQRLDYDAWGRVTQNTNPGFQPFGYAGGLYDGDTHLVRFGVRDYDPDVGRWTMKDPIEFDGGDTNLYAYAANDPVNLTDPSGLFIDTAIDVAFLSYDLAKVAGGCGNLVDLAVDVAAVAVPGATVLAYRAAKAERAARTAPAFRSATRRNFRHNLGVRTGRTPDLHDAHHVLPQKFGPQFSERGINIHDPRYAAWWERAEHRGLAQQYNREWQDFFASNPNASGRQIEAFARDQAQRYGLNLGF